MGSAFPSVADLMADARIVPSRSAARRAIAEGGAYLNNRKVTDVGAVPGPEDLLHGRYLILRVGKRTVGAVEVVRYDRAHDVAGTLACADMRAPARQTWSL